MFASKGGECWTLGLQNWIDYGPCTEIEVGVMEDQEFTRAL
jgi:hypothetical protein